MLGTELEAEVTVQGLVLEGVILDNLNFQINQPEIKPVEEGFSIQTYTRLFRDLDLIDYGELQGASTIKVIYYKNHTSIYMSKNKFGNVTGKNEDRRSRG